MYQYDCFSIVHYNRVKKAVNLQNLCDIIWPEFSVVTMINLVPLLCGLEIVAAAILLAD